MFWRLCARMLAKLPRRSLAHRLVSRLVHAHNVWLWERWDAGWTKHSPLRLFSVLSGLYWLSRLKWDNNPYRRMGPFVLSTLNEHLAGYGKPPLR